MKSIPLLTACLLTFFQAMADTIGNVTGVTVTDNKTATFNISSGGSVEITPFAPDVVRVDFHWVGAFDTSQPMIDKPFDQWGVVGATFTDLGTTYKIETSELIVEIEKTPFRVHFKDKNGYDLLRDEGIEYDSGYNYTGQRGTSISKLKCSKAMPANQAYFGLGEYGGALNRRGRQIECWNTGTYKWGETTNPTYMNIPFFYGLQPATGGNPAFVYGLFFNNPCRPLFKFDGSNQYSFEAGDGRMDYFFFGGGTNHSMANVIDRYSELTGRPTFLPKWGLGHHLSRFSYSNQAWVEYLASEATAQDVPLDAVYLDIDYMDVDRDGDISDGQLRQLTMNTDFGDPAGMVSHCDSFGVKLIPLIEPWLEPGDSLHGEANSNFHFIKDNGGNTVTRGIYVGDVSWFDYTSSSMHSWWQSKIQNWMSSVNFSGIWNDLTEPEGGDSIPHDALLWLDGQFGDSTDSRRHWSNERNYFGLRCSKQSFDTMQAKDPNKRPFILSRSGNAGLQRYAVSWSGDTGADWWYHKTTIRFGMGAVIAGVAWYGNDVGGFVGSPSADLMTRSTEANILAPFFRNHGDKSSSDREPWRFSDPHLGYMRELIKFRYKLMPYLYTLAYEATQNGKPMNVPVSFDYYADANTHNQSDYEYLVGDYLLAAPVYDDGANDRYTYLPYAEGVQWYYWHDDSKYDGGQGVTVSAPVGTLPLFVRSGAIIPMGPSMQYANEFEASWLDIHCWPNAQSDFTLYEDDGETWDHLSGEYAKTPITSELTEDDWTLSFATRQGSFDPGPRDLYTYFYDPPTNDVRATLNGATLPQLADFGDGPQGWKLMDDGRLGFKFPDSSTAKTLVASWGNGLDKLQFDWPTYSVPEDGNFVRVHVTRNGNATGAVSVTYTTADATALAGADYTTTSGTLNWNSADLTNQFIDVPIIDNNSYQSDRTFTLNLNSPVGAELGTPAFTTITITEDDPTPPDLLITNPPTDIVVANEITNYNIQGVANAINWLGLTWTNSLTGDSAQLPIDYQWTINDLPLAIGTNIITVSATNVGFSGASDSASDVAYASAWNDGDNGGTGWAGGWTLADSANSGLFIEDTGAANNDAGNPAWGLWANNGAISEALREFSDPLAIGQEFSFRFDNNLLQNGSSVGFGLRNAADDNLFEFFFSGGNTTYSINDSTSNRDTAIDWSGDGWDITFKLTSATEYEFTCGATLLTGTLQSATNQDIIRFRAWNYNSGTGSDYDYFINNLALTDGGNSMTSDVAQIVRSSMASQIPQTWRDRHALGVSGDDDDPDGDGLTNLQEYWADTDPNDVASTFGQITITDWTNLPPNEIIVVTEVIAATTNSRLYDISYSTNLLGDIWWPFNFNHPGTGGNMIFIHTNDANSALYYRARVINP